MEEEEFYQTAQFLVAKSGNLSKTKKLVYY